MALSSPRVALERIRSRGTASTALLTGTSVAVGLMAGFFYAYACSVMVGLARTDDRTFITTMQWINATVRNAGFAPAFFGSLLLTALAAALAMRHCWPGKRWLLAAAGLYAAAFLVTIGLNVPLNEQLAAAGPPERIPDLAAVRHAFEGPWVRWNLLRTGLCTAALGALGIGMLADRAPGAARSPRELQLAVGPLQVEPRRSGRPA